MGLELSGDPRSGDFAVFTEEFRRAKELGFKISLHCGETEEQQDECQSMIDFRPDRLGHCCYLTDDQIKEVTELNIPVELCPTSNVAAAKCGTVSFLPHLKKFQALKHNLVIGCDDTLLFNTNIGAEFFEYAKAVEVYDVEELKELLIKNIDAIFLDD